MKPILFPPSEKHAQACHVGGILKLLIRIVVVFMAIWLMWLAQIIHECCGEAAETEVRRGFPHVRATQAYLRSVEETEREKPRRARGSAAVAGVHE